MKSRYYVYTLQLSDDVPFYVGSTKHLSTRLQQHISGKSNQRHITKYIKGRETEVEMLVVSAWDTKREVLKAERDTIEDLLFEGFELINVRLPVRRSRMERALELQAWFSTRS